MCRSRYADLSNKKSGEDQEMNVSMETRYTDDHSSESKKNKVIWTPDLHKKFLEAVEKIGVDEAVPKKILELMKVDGLTRDHIASHLQKYRIFLKKLADANNDPVQIASKPSLLESSMINGDPWKNSSLMLNQQKNFPSSNGMHVMMDPSLLDTPSFSFPVLEASSFNPTTSSELLLDTPSFSFPVVEASSFNPTTSSELALSCSIPNQGYSMQESTMLQQTTPKHLNDVATPGIMSSGCASSSSCVQSLDGFVYDYGGNTTYVQPYISAEMGGSFGDLYSSKELPMNLNHENSSPNANGFESNSSTNGEFFEMGSMYGCLTNEEVPNYLHNQVEMNIDLGSNVQNVLEEDDLILDASYIASLWETFFPEENYVDSYTAYGSTSNNLPDTYEPPNQDVNNQNLPNMASYDPVHNEDHVNKQQHTNEHVNEQLMESVEDGVTLETLFLNSYVQD